MPRMRPFRSTLRLFRLEDRAVPAVATWDGGGADSKWTTAANWVGDAAPQPGDDLVFPAGAQQPTNVNDFAPGTAFGSLSVTGSGYSISGNALAVANGVTADIKDGGTVTLALAIGGTGGLASQAGTVVLAGTNTYTGLTTVEGGNLQVTGSVAGPVAVHAGRLYGTGTVGPVTVTDGGVTPGTLSPGNAFTPGALTVGDYTQTGGILELDRTPAGQGRLIIHGAAHLGGILIVGNDDADQPIHAGDRFTVIDNQGTGPVGGTFLAQTEGSVARTTLVPLRITYHGGDGNDVEVYASPQAASAVGSGPGAAPRVNVYDADGNLLRSFLAYDPAFTGGVRVVTADINGDSIPDLITAPGPGGGPDIRVWDGATGDMIREFLAYDPSFRGGVNIAYANIDTPAIVTGAGPGGGPHVKAFGALSGDLLASFMAYDPSFRGGVNVAAVNSIHGRDVQLPGRVITGAGPGGGPHVKVFEMRPAGTVIGTFSPVEVAGFMAYDPAFRGGVNVAAGNTVYAVNGNASGPQGDIITGPASAGGPDVRVFSQAGALEAEFLAYDPSFTGGVQVATLRVGTNFKPVILTGAGFGGGPHVELWELAGTAATRDRSFLAFDPSSTGGVFVG